MFKNKEYVLAIYREGGFTKAAERLYISQPSLSASIKRIEDKISCPIFDRSSSPLGLTEVGEAYVKRALELEELENDFKQYVSDRFNLVRGKIRIGGSSLFSSYVLPKLVAEFTHQYKDIQFEIFEDSTKNLIAKLNSGILDIIIDNAVIKDENVIFEPYTSESLLLAVPKKFQINEKLKDYRLLSEDVKSGKFLTFKAVSLAEFKDLPFVLLNPENDTGSRAIKMFKKHGISPTVLFHLDQQITSYNVTCSGMGISFVSDALVKNAPNEHGVYFYKLNDLSAQRKIYFYQKKNRYLSTACRKFIECNKEK